MASVLSSSTELVVVNPAVAASPEVAHPVALNEALTALLPIETADGAKAEFSEPDKADQVSVGFSADGFELTHDLGGIEADTQVDSSDAKVQLEEGLLDGGSEVSEVSEVSGLNAEGELTKDATGLVLENHSVDFNLGASESSEYSNQQKQLIDNNQNNSDSQTTKTNAKNASSVSLIDIHLVETAEINDGSMLEPSSREDAESTIVDSTQIDTTQIENDQVGTEQLTSDVPDTSESQEQISNSDLHSGSRAANDHAFKQILVSKQPTKNKPQYVENYTPQDLTKKGVLRTTTAKVGAKPNKQDEAADTPKFDEHASDRASEAEAQVVVITAPDLEEITEKRQTRKTPDQTKIDDEITSIVAGVEANAVVQNDSEVVEQAKTDAARLVEEARITEETRQAEAAKLVEEAKQAEAAKLVEEAKLAQAAKLVEEAKQAQAAKLVEEAKQADAARLAEEAKQAEAVRLSEAAALAKATTQAEGFVQAELDAIKIEVELAEAFAKLDLTLDGESTDASFLTGEFVADSIAAESDSIANLESSTESVHAEIDSADSLDLTSTIIDPISTVPNTSAEQLAPAMTSMLKTEHTAQADQTSATGRHALAIAERGSGDSSENINVTTSDLEPVSAASEFVTMAELYDSPEVDLDDTTSEGFGGLPKTNFSQPQGRFYRLWLSVRKTTRNIVDSSKDWLKRIRKK